MDEDELEFEGDSGDDFHGLELEPSRRPEESRYLHVVQAWAQQHPEVEVRFIREDPGENSTVLDLWGKRLEIYVPQDSNSDFFVTTDDEDSRVNAILTELNDMPHVRTLPEMLSEAARLLGSRLASITGALLLQRTQTGSSTGMLETATLAFGNMTLGQPELSRAKSAVVLNFDGLRTMQDELIEKVSLAADLEKHVAALLLLQCKWDEHLLHQRLSSNAASLRLAAGVALAPGEEPRPYPQLCSVCFCDEAVQCLPCGHGLCAEDWTAFLKCNLESGTVDGENCLRLKCPGERCKMLVPASHFKRFLEPGDYSRYLHLRVLSFVNDNQDIAWCPATGCELCIGFSKRKSTVKCTCGHWFCFSCKLPAHAPAKCSSAKAWAEKKEKMKPIEGLRHVSDSKPCPNPACKVLSHKENGCHYLSCPKCKEHWCWQCGDWGGGPSGRPEPHHVFDCNNPINQDWAKASLSNLFDNEGRFWFYHDRHENHLGSLTFARKLLAELPDATSAGIERNPPEISRDYSSVLDYDPIGEGAARSMLDSKQAWTPMRNFVGEWMQIDLGGVYSLVGVVVQGHADKEEWVKTFRVEHGSTSIQPDGVVGEFEGNTDATSHVKVFFNMPVSTRYFRLTPLEWEGNISMRAAALVLEEATCDEAEGQQNFALNVKSQQDAWQLIHDASELLVECRLVLAWTYVWAFFEKDEVKRELFEFVQKDLETKTEQLSEMIENNPLDKVFKERLRLLDYVTALRGYLEHIKEYTAIDPDVEAPKL